MYVNLHTVAFPKESTVWLWFIYHCVFLPGSPRGTLDFSVFGGDCVSWTWIMAGRSEDDSVSNSSGESRWATCTHGTPRPFTFPLKDAVGGRRHAKSSVGNLLIVQKSGQSSDCCTWCVLFLAFSPKWRPDFWFSLVDFKQRVLMQALLKHIYT